MDGCTKKRFVYFKKSRNNFDISNKKIFRHRRKNLFLSIFTRIEIYIYQIKIKIPYAIYYNQPIRSLEIVLVGILLLWKIKQHEKIHRLYFPRYLLYPPISSSIGSCPQTTRPILHRRTPDFSPQRRYIDSSEDRRHEVRRHLRHAIFSMDETFDAIILKARRERIHSGRLLHGTMATGALKPP